MSFVLHPSRRFPVQYFLMTIVLASVFFLKVSATLGIPQAFTSYNNPKGNADTERLMRTLKDGLLWLREWISPLGLEQALTAWIEWDRIRGIGIQHSAIGHRVGSNTNISTTALSSWPLDKWGAAY